MFGFIALVILVFVFVKLSRVNARLDHIESYLQKTTQTLPGTPATSAPEVPSAPPETQPSSAKDAAATTEVRKAPEDVLVPESAEPSMLERFGAWLKEDWLMKLGALLVVLAIGWYVSIALLAGWIVIGPMGRVAIGLLAGAAIMIVGRRRMARFVTQGSILLFSGAAIVIFALYAASEMYGLFDPFVVLVTMFLVAAVLGATSIQIQRPALAYANVGLVAIMPLLVDALPSPTMWYSYLLVLALGCVWVAMVTGWRLIVFLALLIVSFYSLTFIASSVGQDVGLFFAYVYTAVFFATSVLGMRVIRDVTFVDVLTALGSASYLLVWVLAVVESDWQAFVLILWSVVYAFGAFTAVRMGAARAYFYTYGAVAAGFLGLATTLLFDGAVLTLALLVEAGLFLVLGYRVLKRPDLVALLSAPLLVPVVLSLTHIDAREWNTGIMHEHFVMLLIMVAAFVGLARWFAYERTQIVETDESLLDEGEQVSWVVAGLFSATLVWLVTHALAPTDDMGSMLALTIYTLVGAMFYMVGRAEGSTWQRIVAGFIIGVVSLRLFFVEIWAMEPMGRVLTFLVIGAIFIVVAWVERNTMRDTQPINHDQDNN